MPNESLPIYISLKDAATMADRTEKTIRNWIKKGKLETRRQDPGNSMSRILVKEESLKILLATQVQADPPRKKPLEIPQKEELEIITKTLLLETKIAHLEELLEREKKDTKRLEETVNRLEKNLETTRKAHKDIIVEKDRTIEHKDRQIEKLKEELERKADYEREYKRRTSMSWWLRLLDKPVDIPQKQLPGPTPE